MRRAGLPASTELPALFILMTIQQNTRCKTGLRSLAVVIRSLYWWHW